jgi:membrane-associated phospholipid phosphatase
MVRPAYKRETALFFAAITVSAVLATSGCATRRAPISELAVRDAIAHYTATASERLGTLQSPSRSASAPETSRPGCGFTLDRLGSAGAKGTDLVSPYFTLGVMPQEQPASEETQPPASRPAADVGVPEGYWREDIWHQMGHEAKALGGHDFWHGFKASFWDLDNALVLTATMGASVAIRETGVDGTIRNRVHGHRQLGDFDEPIQLLGNPGVHFAGTGVLWLTSTLTKDAKQHELAKTLTQALAVNGVTTLVLKAAANTRAPDNEPYAWPSGHTSSAFTVAAVLNEYYDPWVGVPSLALAGLVGYQRLDSRVHDFSDVVFGAMLGYVVGTSIARDEKAQFPELFGMKVVPFTDLETGASGLALMKSW